MAKLKKTGLSEILNSSNTSDSNNSSLEGAFKFDKEIRNKVNEIKSQNAEQTQKPSEILAVLQEINTTLKEISLKIDNR